MTRTSRYARWRQPNGKKRNSALLGREDLLPRERLSVTEALTACSASADLDIEDDGSLGSDGDGCHDA